MLLNASKKLTWRVGDISWEAKAHGGKLRLTQPHLVALQFGGVL
jgi:hypothetical protein